MSFNTNDIQNYFEDLCTRHVYLKHDTDGRRAFARFRSDEHIRQIQNSITPNIVVVSAVNGQRIGEFDDKKVRRGISLIFAAQAFVADSVTTAINDAITRAEEIMFDFMTQIDKDFAEGCGPLRYFEPEKLSWEDIDGPWLDNYYGWELFVPFKSFMPAYDAAKWSN